MFPSKALLSLILITLTAVDASPLSRGTGKATLGFATKINKRGTLNIVEQDRARAQAMKQATATSQLRKRSASFDITNTGLTYTAEVGIGSPPTNYTLLIDTGSANTWVGADKAYVQTSTSQDTGNTVTVSYGSGNFSGEEWIDTVTLSPDLVISKQSIGVANSSAGMNPGIDGIIGVGPTGLTNDTIANTVTIPTVSDNLLSQGTISEEVLGVYYIPIAETGNGELTFGGYDESATSEPVVYVPLTTTSPASEYWGIDQSISYGDDVILSTTAGIVDTGTTLILIATDAFNTYQTKTGGILDSTTTLLSITPDQYDNLSSLWFNIGTKSYELTPNAQIWPRSLNTAIGGNSTAIYLIVSDIGTPSGSGLDFMNGYTFLERYYSVYDTTNGQVGFAPTQYTTSESN